MAGFFGLFKKRKAEFSDEENYVELESGEQEKNVKVMVRPFALETFEDVKPVLNALREGNTIAIIDISPMKENDIETLKRAVDKIKKSVSAIDGDVAGFSENWLIATPSFARIYREGRTSAPLQTAPVASTPPQQGGESLDDNLETY